MGISAPSNQVLSEGKAEVTLLLMSAECPGYWGNGAQSDTPLSCRAPPGTPTLQIRKVRFLLLSLGFRLRKALIHRCSDTLLSSSGYCAPRPALPAHILTEHISLFQPRTLTQKQIRCIYDFGKPKGHYYCSWWHREGGRYSVSSVLLYHFII